MDSFEKYWNELGIKNSVGALENAFREIAEKSWNHALVVHNVQTAATAGAHPSNGGPADYNTNTMRIICEQLGIPESNIIDPTFPQKHIVSDLGADSLDVIELVMALEDEYLLEIPDEVMSKTQTVQDIINYINNTVGQ